MRTSERQFVYAFAYACRDITARFDIKRKWNLYRILTDIIECGAC